MLGLVPRESTRQRRSISLLTETLAYIGAILVLTGGGVTFGQAWRDISAWGHVSIFAATALLFFAVGVVVVQVSEPAIQRMVSVVWLVSAGCIGAAAGTAASGPDGSSGPVAVLAAGSATAAYSAILWLARRRELQLLAMFTGITIAVGASIITIAGSAGPRLAIALGLWAMGAGWVIVGWQYPQPLWSTVPLAIAITLIAPGIAVWQHGWVFAIGIGTAGAAIVVAVSRRRTALLAAGTLTLFGYVTSAVVRYFHASLGLPATLAACGVLLLALSVVMARVRRSVQRDTAGRQTAELHTAARLAEELAAEEPDLHESAPSAEPEVSDEPILHLPKAS
jgi:hypothetical protein